MIENQLKSSIIIQNHPKSRISSTKPSCVMMLRYIFSNSTPPMFIKTSCERDQSMSLIKYCFPGSGEIQLTEQCCERMQCSTRFWKGVPTLNHSTPLLKTVSHFPKGRKESPTSLTLWSKMESQKKQSKNRHPQLKRCRTLPRKSI